METTIQEGNMVIIQKGTFMRSDEVRLKIKRNIHKLCFLWDNAIGCKYGTVFNVGRNGHLSVCNAAQQPKPVTITSGDNNQFLNDDGSSQKLTKDAIMDLKAHGLEGEEIVEQLVENSETFEKKTKFSQQKYLNKKRNRHLSQITVLKPTLRLVCEMTYANCPQKILDLRMDTVSQILTMANICSNINVLLVESTQSFLAGAILYRMGGVGNVVQLHKGDFPIRLLLPQFGLQKNDLKILSGFPLHKINRLHSLHKEDIQQVSEEMDATECAEVGEAYDVDECSTRTSQVETITREKRQPKYYNKPLTEIEKQERKIKRIEEANKALELLKNASFDSLIIASKSRAKTVVLRLLEFLAPSRPVVVYSPFKEVLMECYLELKENKSVVNLEVTETWWRSYQVLSMRTHPHVMMDGCGGYLLTGIKVEHGLTDSTDNLSVDPNFSAISSDPTNLDLRKQDKTNVKPVAHNEMLNIDTYVKDSAGKKSDVDFNVKPDGVSVEPPVKKTKSC